MSYTRVEARRAIALEARDLIRCTHTGASSTSVFSDRLNLLEDDNAYTGCWGIVIAAANPANRGQQFRVIGSTQATGSITVIPPLPAAITATDTFDLHNLMGKGFRPNDLNDTIREVIADLEADFLIPSMAPFPAPFTADDPRLLVPAAMDWVYRVEWQHHDQTWHDVPPRYWRADLANNKVEILGNWSEDLNGALLRAYGLGRHPVVDDDDDPITVDRTYLKWMTLATLGRRRTGSKEWLQNAAIWNQAAERARVNLDWVREANAKRVR